MLADQKPPFEYDSNIFEEAARMVYDNGGFEVEGLSSPQAQAVTEETQRILQSAISSQLPTEVPDTLRYALENNSFVFSGFKTFHTLREVGLSMITDKGEIKPFEAFLTDVRGIHEKYNKNYLYAEYNHAVSSSQMAVKWHEFEENEERYNLQYRTAGDSLVREEHAALGGVTLPASDPFWQQYYPPNGWNCRCTVAQVRKSKFEMSDSEAAIALGEECTGGAKDKMFRYNAGATLQLFPPKHPYTKVPAKAKAVITQLTEEQIKEKRIEALRQQLPSYLTDAERAAKAANNYDIEQALGILAGKPMSVEAADKQSANPNHQKRYILNPNGEYKDKSGNRFSKNPNYKASDRQYSVNCQTCAPAYALRLMGIDVTAKGKTAGSLSEYLSRQKSFEAWQNIDGSSCTPTLTHEWMSAKGYKRMTEKRYKEYFNETCKDEGVYVLTIGWKGGSGHATILQKFNDGSLHYIEPQSYESSQGAKRSIDELCVDGATMPIRTRGILRVDNKVFNTKFISIFDK